MSEWRAIPGFPGYVISTFGEVQGKRWTMTGHIRNGYRRVNLGGVNRPVHLLVLETFGPPRPSPAHEGAHLDGDRMNNHASNLAWKTRHENEADKRKHATWRTAPGTRLSPRQLAHARKMHAAGVSYTKIAARYGVHRYTVARLLRGTC